MSIRRTTTKYADRFCIYCQRQFPNRKRFVRHIVSKHRDTYAFERVLTEEERRAHGLESA